MSVVTEQRCEPSKPELTSGAALGAHTIRLNSEDLFQQRCEVEIEHQGRIYRLRRTQQNKLILTA